MEKALWEGNQQYVGMDILSQKHTTQFYIIPLWWLRISRCTRIFYAPTTRGYMIPKEHVEKFGGWLLTHLNNDNTVSDELFLLSRGPSSTIWTFQGYEINGNTFYTNMQDKKSTNQNSGVRFDDSTNNNGRKGVTKQEKKQILVDLDD